MTLMHWQRVADVNSNFVLSLLSLITRSLRSSMYFRLKGDTVVYNVKHLAIACVLCRWPLEC